MTSIPMYQIDAFSDRIFAGNPAAVCVLDEWLADDVMQSIAAENNLAETAFIVAINDAYDLRWFTPEQEVDLCGHATLASAFVIFEFLQTELNQVRFMTASGELLVSQGEAGRLVMDFPARKAQLIDTSTMITECLGVEPLELRQSRDLLVVFADEQQLRCLTPDFEMMKRIPEVLGVIATAPGDEVDFVSRFFAPKVGVIEDPVTGSAHCSLIPYWSERLGKNTLQAKQISRRGGQLWCEYLGQRVSISGYASLYLSGQVHLTD